MKIAGLSIAYNEENLIRGCIKSLQPAVHEHLVLISDKPYYGSPEPPDKTEKIATDLGAAVLRGVWPLDHNQRNTGISILKDYDWIIATDVDMWLTREGLDKIVEQLYNTTASALVIKQAAYWHNVDHRLVNDDFTPVIAIKPNVRFSFIGNVDHPVECLDDVICHHINWCAPKDIYKKVTTYPHAPEFDGHDWYHEHYKNWEDGPAIMPDGKVFEVEVNPLPDELKAYL